MSKSQGSMLVGFSVTCRTISWFSACHPCARAMLIFSISLQFYKMFPKGLLHIGLCIICFKLRKFAEPFFFLATFFCFFGLAWFRFRLVSILCTGKRSFPMRSPFSFIFSLFKKMRKLKTEIRGIHSLLGFQLLSPFSLLHLALSPLLHTSRREYNEIKWTYLEMSLDLGSLRFKHQWPCEPYKPFFFLYPVLANILPQNGFKKLFPNLVRWDMP